MCRVYSRVEGLQGFGFRLDGLPRGPIDTTIMGFGPKRPSLIRFGGLIP